MSAKEGNDMRKLMTDAARLDRLSSLALRTLNTMHSQPSYAGQCATDETRNELEAALLVTVYHGNLADPTTTRLTLTSTGERIASKALDAIKARA